MKDKSESEITIGDDVMSYDNNGDLALGKITDIVEVGPLNQYPIPIARIKFTHEARVLTRFSKEIEKVGMVASESIKSINRPAMAPAMNNHTCPTCKNTRCSKSEIICWRCGNRL